MLSLMQVIYMMLTFYMWVLIITGIMSWLLAFNVVNPHNEFVSRMGEVLRRLTEPALRPIRKFVPTLNGVDLSYLALFFGLLFLRLLIQNNFHIY